MTKALSARTGRDLGGLLADLPSARDESGVSQPGTRLPGPLILMSVLAAAILVAGVAAGGWHHVWVPWPLFWLVPIMVLRFSWWRRYWRGRQGTDPCPHEQRHRRCAGRAQRGCCYELPPG